MMIPYDTSLIPPAPFLSAHVSNLTGSAESPPIPAKVDTGADVTAIPANLVNQLNLVLASEIQVEGYNGHRATLPCYDIVLRVAHLRVVGLSVISFSEDYILLGRDVLNLLRLLLDGPALWLEVLSPQSPS
ncbi:MAG TPA: retroviral-like aspartic protease family protein [Anaerolineae bacterium]|nr:retroviral-like aspartic protease family protein [Anaerolineae bacterium]